MSREDKARGKGKRGKMDSSDTQREAWRRRRTSMLLGALHNLRHREAAAHPAGTRCSHDACVTHDGASPGPAASTLCPYVTPPPPRPSPIERTSTPVVPAMMQTSTMPRKRPWSTTPSSARMALEAAAGQRRWDRGPHGSLPAGATALHTANRRTAPHCTTPACESTMGVSKYRSTI